MYKLTKTNVILNTVTGASFPMDAENSDYRKYLEWVAKGNTPLPAQTQEEIDAEALEKAKADADQKISSIMSTDVMADLLVFVATINGAPQSLKNAAALAATEKAKKPK